jgi:hypothetical protein
VRFDGLNKSLTITYCGDHIVIGFQERLDCKQRRPMIVRQ